MADDPPFPVLGLPRIVSADRIDATYFWNSAGFALAA